MSKVEDFLTKEEEQEIVQAIQIAEKDTSGEIRVHIEKTTSIDAFDRALEVFHLLKMDETALKNGVLIYLAVDDLLLERMQIAGMDFGNDLTFDGSKVFDKLFSRF